MERRGEIGDVPHEHRACPFVPAQLGRLEEARREGQMFMLGNPAFRISFWSESQPFTDHSMKQHFLDGYRQAGLPE